MICAAASRMGQGREHLFSQARRGIIPETLDAEGQPATEQQQRLGRAREASLWHRDKGFADHGHVLVRNGDADDVMASGYKKAVQVGQAGNLRSKDRLDGAHGVSTLHLSRCS
jgi:hypothetical protein